MRLRFELKLAWRNLFTTRPPRTAWTSEPFCRVLQQPHNCVVDVVTCVGTANDGEVFCKQAYIECDKAEEIETAKQMLRGMLDSYLLPKCRCRFGLHWRCSIHKNWKN